MQPFVEAWSGMELVAHQAYGFRLYREGNQLMMHTDKSQTHVISFILHIDSSEDAEPWPLLIEDFYGNTHEVVLTPGDLLLYQSSKCNHGRPYRFRGGPDSWYTSVFVHYYPRHG
jgi:predicted 2-oxoglutarate/Fe(II)-dependent dioxygenase YbiX